MFEKLVIKMQTTYKHHTEFTFHVVAATHLVHKTTLKRVHFRIQLHHRSEYSRARIARRTSRNWIKPISPSSATVACATSECTNNCTKDISSDRNSVPIFTLTADEDQEGYSRAAKPSLNASAKNARRRRDPQNHVVHAEFQRINWTVSSSVAL